MTCERMQEILDAYLDGEVPAPDAREIEEHLHDCTACAGALASRKALQTALRTKLAYYRAPVTVRAGVAGLQEGRAADADVVAPRLTAPANVPAVIYSAHSTAWWRRTALGLAACLALVCFALTGLLTAPHHAASPNLDQLVLSDHLRSLEGVALASADPAAVPSPHLVDVASSDKHVVRPWFAGKLPFAPAVPELDGFTLVGGRLDMLLDKPVAALVYRHDRHIINLFLWPQGNGDDAPAPAEPAPHEVAGYHEVEFAAHGFHCWAISDVEMNQLAAFARAYAAASTAPADQH